MKKAFTTPVIKVSFQPKAGSRYGADRDSRRDDLHITCKLQVQTTPFFDLHYITVFARSQLKFSYK